MIGTFWSADSALLLINHQVGTMKLMNIPLDVVKRNTLALAKTAKILNIPVVLTSSQEQNVRGRCFRNSNKFFLRRLLPGFSEPELLTLGVIRTTKRPSKRQVAGISSAGVTTDVCLVYPAISACREGYQVQAVMDASGSPYELSEDMSRRRMEREGVVLTATNTLMAELAQDWSRPEGGQLLGILFQDVLPPIA